MRKIAYATVYIHEDYHDETSVNIMMWKNSFVKGFRLHICVKPYIKKGFLFKALQKKLGLSVQYKNKEILYFENSNIFTEVNGFCDITTMTKYLLSNSLVKQQMIDKLSEFIGFGCIVINGAQVAYTKKQLKTMIP